MLGIAPGGAYESLFGDKNYPVFWQRLGFAKVALKANKPIIPVFTENIREPTLSLAGRMNVGRRKITFGIISLALMLSILEMWENLYKSTKMPVVPMYGLFPVKLRTHIGAPIYPSPDMTPEQLNKLAVEAIEKLIAEHQVLPGTLTQALAARIDDSGRLSRASSRMSLSSTASSSSLSQMSQSQDECKTPTEEESKSLSNNIPTFTITVDREE